MSSSLHLGFHISVYLNLLWVLYGKPNTTENLASTNKPTTADIFLFKICKLLQILLLFTYLGQNNFISKATL